jgi:hypothetical protein
MAGEGAAAFLVNDQPFRAQARLEAIRLMHGEDANQLQNWALAFIQHSGFGDNDFDLLLSGENGDRRVLEYYETIEGLIHRNTGIYRFKHLCGEYATATAYALWLACQILDGMNIPAHMVKREASAIPIRRILIYNNFKKVQHSLILVTAGHLV